MHLQARHPDRTAAPTTAQDRGFTLLELLVVMFIVGIIAAMATLSVGVASATKSTEKEMERIEDLLMLASEEALVQGREFGITFYRREYEFSAYDVTQARWTPLAADSGPLSPRQFPPDALVDLEIEDRLVALADQKPQRRDTGKAGKDEDSEKRDRILGRKEEHLPQVFILSSGDITPFELRLRPGIGRPGISLKVAADGTIETVRDER